MQVGRKADWFRERCAEILDQEKLVDFVGRVAAGRETEDRFVKDEGIIKIACSTRDRLAAFEMLANWGVGKPIPVGDQPQKTYNDSVRQAQQIYEMVKDLEQGQLVTTNGNH